MTEGRLTAIVLAAVAAVTLALTCTCHAATPAENLQAIEQLTERQANAGHRNRAGNHSRILSSGSTTGADPVAADNAVAGHVVPTVPVLLTAAQSKPVRQTNELSPAELAYLERRPWMLLSRPVAGAVRVQGGWLIHSREFDQRGHSGFYRPRTAQEANALKH